MKLFSFGVFSFVVVGLSALSIAKIIEKPTTSCVDEVAELTQASDAIGTVLFVSDEPTLKELQKAINPTTKLNVGLPYIMVATLGNDGMSVYIKILFEDSKTYTRETETEVKQIQSSMHKADTQCSLNGKKYDVYRAKTLLELLKISNPI